MINDMSLFTFKKMLTDNYAFNEILSFIDENVDEACYEVLLTQKILWKLIFSKIYSTEQKDYIIYKLGLKFLHHKSDFYNHIAFLKAFYPIVNNIYHDIQEKISKNFDDSLFLFTYCFGIFVYENPDIIFLPKKFIYNIAYKAIKNDLNYGNVQAKINLANSVYDSRKRILEYIYKEAIKYGAIYEKYDDISYLRSNVLDVFYKNNKPVAKIAMKNPEFELGIQQGDAYNAYLYNAKLNSEPDFVHSYYNNYYKCKVCKYCTVMNQDEELEDFALQLLDRQYKQMNLTDLFYFFTGTIPSYILSILSFLYTELLLVVLFSEDNYKILDKDFIKKNMLFSNHISEEDFNMCISLICNYGQKDSDNCHSTIPFFQLGDKIIIGKWMYDNNFSIIEEAKNISFNNIKSNKLGESANYFGKNVFEKIVKGKMTELGWGVVDFSIKLKNKKSIKTDIDLLAFKNGIVVIGQLKVANCGRSPYQIWKASETIKRGINQAKSCIDILQNDSNLLYSILKKVNIVKAKVDIKEIIPIVVTSNNYFSKVDILSNISVISFDMLCELLYYAQDDATNEFILQSLKDPISQYNFNKSSDIVISEIDNEKYQLFYEEYE